MNVIAESEDMPGPIQRERQAMEREEARWQCAQLPQRVIHILHDKQAMCVIAL